MFRSLTKGACTAAYAAIQPHNNNDVISPNVLTQI